MTPLSSEPIRVGVVLGSAHPPEWIHTVLAGIEDANSMSLQVCVTLREPTLTHQQNWALQILEALDARFLGAGHGALKRSQLTRDLRGRLVDADTADTAARALVEHDLDVVLALEAPPDGFQTTARHGVWSVQFGGHAAQEAVPHYFWDLYDRSLVCSAAIRVDDAAGGHLVYHARSATDPVSLHRNRSTAAWKASRALLLRLQELHDASVESLLRHAHVAERESSLRTIRLPHVLRVCFGILRTGLSRFLEARFGRGEWLVAYGRRESWPPWQASRDSYVVLPSPRGRFLADPFLLEHDGRHILFMEDFIAARGKAVISWLEIGETGAMGEPRPALEREYHLSYPFVFEHSGDVYMIPETAAAKRVELYRADSIPSRWTRVRVLLDDVAADDATVLEHAGRFWLFASVAPEGVSALQGELFLFFADSLEGNWTPHPWNPVVTDVRSGRPAGRIFAQDGAWIRPAQDCSRRYGYATILNRVDELTTATYRETAVARIGPEWLEANLATHTYNRDSLYETVDGYRRHRRLPRWAGPA
jgi:hypothetical protein